eukprot:2500055-Alexandrium_andersonii.AAC.1
MAFRRICARFVAWRQSAAYASYGADLVDTGWLRGRRPARARPRGGLMRVDCVKRLAFDAYCVA